MTTVAHAKTANTHKSAYKRMMDLMGFRWKWSALVQAARLRLGDRLADGPLTIDALARQTGTDAPSLYLLLQFLAYSGIFTETSEGIFAHNDMSHFLRSDVPFSLYHVLLLEASDWNRGPWDDMRYTLQTGRPAVAHTQGETLWDYFTANPEQQQVFDAATRSLSELFDDELAAAYDFADVRDVVDVGGGQGTLLIKLLQTYPQLHGTVLDRSTTVGAAAELLAEAALDDRGSALAGDFFTHVPPGADVYVLKQVLHLWNDRQASAILRSCRAGMRPDSRLLIAEMFSNPPSTSIPEGGYDPFVGYQALQVLLLFGGRERSEAQFRALLAQADLECVEMRRTRSPYRLFVCRPTG